METINVSDLSHDVEKTLNKVIKNNSGIRICRPDLEDVVLLGIKEFNSMKETLFLLSSEKNRKRLQEGMEQVKSGKTTKIDINAL